MSFNAGWNEKLTTLTYVLAELYPVREDAIPVIKQAGLRLISISLSNKALTNWHNIIDEARKTHRVLELIRAAREEYPDHAVLREAEIAEAEGRSTLTNLSPPQLNDKDLTWKGEPDTDVLEKVLGRQSTLLPISFLESGLQRARSVARVARPTGERGSGFLTTGNVFVTNHHILKNESQASEATLQFNYQQTATGLDLEPVNFSLDPENGFATSKPDDWTLVRVKGEATSTMGAIEIEPIDIRKDDRVNIIQHPMGGPKQIALYHNVVAYADATRVQYLTDTLPGSSGSPVFNNNWQVVALHHSGGWILEPGTKRSVYRNEGININVVLQALNQFVATKGTK